MTGDFSGFSSGDLVKVKIRSISDFICLARKNKIADADLRASIEDIRYNLVPLYIENVFLIDKIEADKIYLEDKGSSICVHFLFVDQIQLISPSVKCTGNSSYASIVYVNDRLVINGESLNDEDTQIFADAMERIIVDRAINKTLLQKDNK